MASGSAQRRGVHLLALELADETELAADQVLVAPAQVGQGLGGVAAQQGLFARQLESRALDSVQRARDRRDLSARTGRRVHRFRRVRRARARRVPAGHRVRQPPGGDVVRLVG